MVQTLRASRPPRSARARSARSAAEAGSARDAPAQHPGRPLLAPDLARARGAELRARPLPARAEAPPRDAPHQDGGLPRAGARLEDERAVELALHELARGLVVAARRGRVPGARSRSRNRGEGGSAHRSTLPRSKTATSALSASPRSSRLPLRARSTKRSRRRRVALSPRTHAWDTVHQSQVFGSLPPSGVTRRGKKLPRSKAPSSAATDPANASRTSRSSCATRSSAASSGSSGFAKK